LVEKWPPNPSMCAHARTEAAEFPAGPHELSHMGRHIQTFKLNLTYTVIKRHAQGLGALVAYLAT
jgi:hypothetical protein